MAREQQTEPEIRVTEDGFNAAFSLSPRPDQTPSRPINPSIRRAVEGGRHHHRNHSIDTKDRTSPILGFGPLQHDKPWGSIAEEKEDKSGEDASPVSYSTTGHGNSLDPSRAINGLSDTTLNGPRQGSQNGASSANGFVLPSTANSRKVSSASTSSSSSTGSTGSASPETSSSSDTRRSSFRLGDRHPVHAAPTSQVEASSRRNASPARSFTGAPISPRLQSSYHSPMGHNRRTSGDYAGSAPYRAPSPIFLPSTSPPTVPINPDPQHSWDSVWPRSSTPDRSDQIRRLGSPSPVAGSPGRASPTTHQDSSSSSNLSRSPSASFELGSPATSTTPILGRPKARRPHELRASASSPVLRVSPTATRDSQDSNKSPRRSLEAARTEPVLRVGFNPMSNSTDPNSLQASAWSPGSSANPASRVLSPPTEASPHVDVATAVVSHRTNGVSSSWIPERATSPSMTSMSDPRKRSTAISVPYQLPLPIRTPSPKLSPVSPRSPFLELRAPSPGANGTPVPMSESPPKTRSFIAMPPRSGYDLSDDPDDVGSEDGSNSERESVGTNDEDTEEADDDDDDDDGNDNDSEDMEQDHDENKEVDEHRGRDLDDQSESQEEHGRPTGSKERPALPKRPSLTRSSVVPAPIVLPEQPHGPMDPIANAESSLRALAAQKASSGSSMLNYFKESNDLDGPEGGQRIDLKSDEQVSDTVMPSALGLDAGQQHSTEDAMEEEDDQGFGAAHENPEDSLNTLERIFLFAKSDMAYHRVLVSQSLPEWIREVELNDAVEYIIPLLNGLATDEVEVCAAFAPEIGRVMWYFFRNCPIAELADQPADEEERATRPKISVATFTTLLCALLLNQNTIIAGATQQSLVQFFYRLEKRDLELSKEELALKSPQEVQARSQEQDLDSFVTHASGRDGQPVPHQDYEFDANARNAVRMEILENVALALAQLSHYKQSQIEAGADSESRSGGSAKVDVKPEGQEPSSRETEDEDMEEDEAEGAKAQADDQWSRPETKAESSDTFEDEMEEQDLGSDPWTQGGTLFGHHSNSSGSEFQIDEDEEAAVGRMASVSLLAALAADELIPEESLLRRFAPEILNMIDDKAFYVRKEVASSLGPLAKNMAEEVVLHKVLPALDRVVHDRNWHVRQAACFSLPVVLGRLNASVRREKTLAFMRALVNDVSRQLRIAALEIIGEAIYMFHDDEAGVPEELVRFFLAEPFDGPPQQGDATLSFDKTSDPEGTEALFEEEGGMDMDSDFDQPASQIGEPDSLLASFGFGKNETSMTDTPWDPNFRISSVDPERPLVVAFNFPAVALTLGPTRWARLRHAHAELTQNAAPKVRKSLAASLHEIAKIIGPDATRDDLLPAAERFLRDDDIEVRASLLENVDVFLSCLPQLDAERMLRSLLELWSTGFSRDWRGRERLTLHIPSMAKQFLLEDEEGNLVSLMQLALSDPVSSVRDAGVHCVPDLYKIFAEHEQVIADGFLGMVSDLGDSQGYRLRVACLLCIKSLVEFGVQRSSCEMSLLGRLTQMGQDPVVDVRIVLAKTVGLMCHKDELYAMPQSRSDELNQLIARLMDDPCEEVREPVAGILTEESLARYHQALQSVPTQPRRLVLGPADGGPHRPEGEGAFTNDFMGAEDEDDEGAENEQQSDVFRMDDEENRPAEVEQEGQGDLQQNEEGRDGSELQSSSSASDSAHHLETQRNNFFSAKNKPNIDLGSGWLTQQGPEFFDYDEDEDEAGEDEEPHHLLSVDRDSNGSGEFVEREGGVEDDEDSSPAPAASQQRADTSADTSAEIGEGGDGISLSSPQRNLEGHAKLTDEESSPSRPSASATGSSGSKAADPFLAFVAGRRTQDLSKLKLDLGGSRDSSASSSSPSSSSLEKRSLKRGSIVNGVAEAISSSHSPSREQDDEVLQSPVGEEGMNVKHFSKTSGDWSQLQTKPTSSSERQGTEKQHGQPQQQQQQQQQGSHDAASSSAAGNDPNEDDFVQIETTSS